MAEHKRRKTDNQHNGKVTIREIYELVFPMTETIADTKKDIAVMKGDVSNIKDDVEELKTCIKGKISIKAFTGWLIATSVILTIAFAIMGFYFRGF